MVIKWVLLLALARMSGSTLMVSPLNKGVMGKVSKDFLQNIANEVTDKVSSLLKVPIVGVF